MIGKFFINLLLARRLALEPKKHADLLRRPHDPSNGRAEPFPLQLLGQQLLSSEPRKPIRLGSTVGIRVFPFRDQPALSLKTVQRRVQGTVIDLQSFVRHPFDYFGNLVAVCRTVLLQNGIASIHSSAGRHGLLP